MEEKGEPTRQCPKTEVSQIVAAWLYPLNPLSPHCELNCFHHYLYCLSSPEPALEVEAWCKIFFERRGAKADTLPSEFVRLQLGNLRQLLVPCTLLRRKVGRGGRRGRCRRGVGCRSVGVWFRRGGGGTGKNNWQLGVWRAHPSLRLLTK